MATVRASTRGRRAGSGAHDYVHLQMPNWFVRRLHGERGRMRLRLVLRPSRAFAAEAVELVQRAGGIGGEDVPTLFGPFEPEITADVARAEFTLEAGERADWVIAAATTSLPEAVGGTRNWDYRYSWLRDATFTLYALSVLGYSGEAAAFVDWLGGCVARSLPEIRIMYAIDGSERLDERELDHLEGWHGSRPVRVGNGAWNQRQIDVYGEVLDFAWLYRSLGGRLDAQAMRLLEVFVDFVRRHWQEPDQGLWEMRGAPRHHLHGKLMCWVAMDRAVRLFGPRPEFMQLRETIRATIFARGRDPRHGHLLQAFDHPGTDAAVLLAPMLGFPLDDDTLEATLQAVQRELRHGPWVHRYRGDDGLGGEEGAFLICSFWLVDALLAADRRGEAEDLFTAVGGATNDVGLFAEEVDPHDGAFLGNMPQAFTHLALIGSAVNLELHARGGTAALAGGAADRAQRAVGRTFGWRAILEAIRQCRRVGRLLPSKSSILFWP